MKRNRAILKGYFKEGCIPKEADFADLIDSMLNQEEDGLEKLPSGPLSVTPFEETLIRFKQVEQADKLGWQIKQNTSPKPGLSISEGTDSRLFIENGTGNVGIGVTQPTAKLEIGGNLKIADTSSELFFQDKGQIRSADDNHRILFRRDENILELREYGKIVFSPGATEGKETASVTLASSGNVGIGTDAPDGKLEVVGAVAINDGNGSAVKTKHMASGSLTIGSTAKSYGGGSKWNENSAGLMLETQKNTEIAVHDSEHRLASLMYYEGDNDNRITIGRDMGWGTTGLSLGNSDLYFTKTDHNHTGAGNTAGYAAIENAKDYDALMILGRSKWENGKFSKRIVKLYDYVEVHGELRVTGAQNILKVKTFTLAVKNAGGDQPGKWSVDYSDAGFSEIYTVFVCMQGYSLFNNDGRADFGNLGHVVSAECIPQHAYVRVTSQSIQKTEGVAYCSESKADFGADNTVLFTVIVMGRV